MPATRQIWHHARLGVIGIIGQDAKSVVLPSFVEELRATLGKAVASQMMSDVPLGAFLSGGIDSSTIVALMAEVSAAPVRTFSIAFREGSYDESSYAREIARLFRTEHREEAIDPDVARLFDRLVVHLDEPFADVSLFPTFLVSEVASRHVKVARSEGRPLR